MQIPFVFRAITLFGAFAVVAAPAASVAAASVAAASVAAASVAVASAADPSAVLRVERKQDKRGRTLLHRRLAQVTADLHADGLAISEVAEWLGLVAGDGVNVLYVGADRGTAAEPTVTLDLDGKKLTQIIAIVSDLTDLAFVYRNGVVMIKPEEDVREETELRVYDLRAATAPLRSFAGPRLGGLHPSGYEPEEDDLESEFDSGTISGFTAEDVEQLVRDNVTTGSWDAEGVSLSLVGGLLVVQQTERGHAQVRSTLRAIGVGGYE